MDFRIGRARELSQADSSAVKTQVSTHVSRSGIRYVASRDRGLVCTSVCKELSKSKSSSIYFKGWWINKRLNTESSEVGACFAIYFHWILCSYESVLKLIIRKILPRSQLAGLAHLKPVLTEIFSLFAIHKSPMETIIDIFHEQFVA